MKPTPEQIADAIEWFDEEELAQLSAEYGSISTKHVRTLLAALVPATSEAQNRIKAAIRRQTVEAPNDMPNGPTEKAFYELGEALKPRGNMAIHWDKFANVRRFFGELGQAMIDDAHELREAADEFFEEDFTKP